MPKDDDFFESVAHDLRGELNTIFTVLQVLPRNEKTLSPMARDMIERARGAVVRQKRMVDELEDTRWFRKEEWLRENPKRRLGIEACPAREIIAAALRGLEEAAAARGVRVSTEVADGAPVQGDPGLLAKALEHIIAYAIRRSRDREVRVRLSYERGAPVVTVADDAGPVKPELFARLLEPCVAKEAIPYEQSRRKEGLGLGLAIARGIFEEHGGGLQVELVPEDGAEAGAEGGGLRFTCTLGPATPA